MISLVVILSLFTLSAADYYISDIMRTECGPTKMTFEGSLALSPTGCECLSIYFEEKVGVGNISVLARTCKDKCHFLGSRTIQKNHYVVDSRCCGVKFNCKPDIMRVSWARMRYSKSGLICPTCTSDNSCSCNSTETVRCSDDEDMCFLRIETARGKDYYSRASRGCATKSYCDHGNYTVYQDGSIYRDMYICTKARNPDLLCDV